MHRSSESVAAIATALAKAQTELSNPEKAMVGMVYNNRTDAPQSFRYASLSSGLDIVRKTLGGHQIAIAQTTDIDRASGMVNLTTLLLHTSGEWISSDWPVCQLSETSAPRRMGAADLRPSVRAVYDGGDRGRGRPRRAIRRHQRPARGKQVCRYRPCSHSHRCAGGCPSEPAPNRERGQLASPAKA
jgi:ERF superfamily